MSVTSPACTLGVLRTRILRASLLRYDPGAAGLRLDLFSAAAVLVGAFALFGCSARIARIGPRAAPRPTIVWTYDVHAEGPDASVLRIEAFFAPIASDALDIEPSAESFVREARYGVNGGWEPLPRTNGIWRIPCHARIDGCRIRYTFALREAAAELDDLERAASSSGVLVAPPSTWLLHPSESGDRDRFRVRVTTEDGARFATGMRPAADGGTFEAATKIVDHSSFAVFGRFDVETIRSGAARVEVAIALPTDAKGHAAHAPDTGATSPAATRATGPDDRSALSPDDIVAWVKRAVVALSAYYGTFPVSKVLVVVLRGDEGETRGETISEGGPAIVIRTARGLTAAATVNDWVLTHELIHATLPSFGHLHAWLDEGIATYVEPVARTRAGLMAVETFWRELEDGLPQGLPEANDQGLDRTHTWGRTYWGGALFCFVADVRIREATHGARSFDDALRALAAQPHEDSGTVAVESFLEIGDRATGTGALTNLYRELAFTPARTDLASLWSRLGVRRKTGGVVFDDSAPLAFVRLGITGSGIAGSD